MRIIPRGPGSENFWGLDAPREGGPLFIGSPDDTYFSRGLDSPCQVVVKFRVGSRNGRDAPTVTGRWNYPKEGFGGVSSGTPPPT